ncbi:MAG: MarR family transcriptional regulator [Sulfolobales archaeon]|nr:MarR family transcriptional regulator [Sulfolobales archaeon]MCX8198771.1 MarR family transcriptional regulator [Sulfolobales archaeon]MDW8169844.1 MarR family transcriptional regulator [Desulfurococcaceae archaeon]
MEFEELSDVEKKALEVIANSGDAGIFQNDLWKLLGVNSRDTSRIVNKLLKRGLIVRKPAVNRGRRTYLLLISKKAAKPEKKVPMKINLRIDLDRFIEIPCFNCPFIHKCYIGGFYNPITCNWLEEWINSNVVRRQRSSQ